MSAFDLIAWGVAALVVTIIAVIIIMIIAAVVLKIRDEFNKGK